MDQNTKFVKEKSTEQVFSELKNTNKNVNAIEETDNSDIVYIGKMKSI